jgi:uroporphyrinogen-III synthase
LNVRLLVTRPQPDAERTAAALRARGHDITMAPFLHIQALPDAELGSGPWAALLVTSANAAFAIAQHPRAAELKNVPVLAVGERSARAMRAAGFADVISAGGDGGDLARLAVERLKQGVPLLYLAGADRSGDIAGDLAAQNYIVRVAVIYRAVAVTALPQAAADALVRGIDGVLHFSRRSAEAYVNAARNTGLLEAALTTPRHFCLSAQVAEPLAQAGAADVRVAARPDEATLFELVGAA